MKNYNLFCPIRKANPYRRMAKALKTNNVADNILNREFKEHGPRMVLLTDITYIPYHNTKCYLSVILDAFTKEILSYVLSESLEVDFVLRTSRISLIGTSRHIAKSAETTEFTVIRDVIIQAISFIQIVERQRPAPIHVTARELLG